MRPNHWLACGFAISMMALACGKERGEPATTTTTGAMTHDDAIMRLGAARCDREATCNNLGPGKKYPDRDACVREASQNARGTLRSDECRTLDDAKVNACIADIRNERCGNPIDSLDTVMSCTQKKMCLEK